MPIPCPSCNKFASLSPGDGEVELDDFSAADCEITGTVRFVLTSGCCGDEMKEYTFEVSIGDVDLSAAEFKEFKVDPNVDPDNRSFECAKGEHGTCSADSD